MPEASGQSFLKRMRPVFRKPHPIYQGEFGMRLLHSLVSALALLASSSATAQTTYPDRPIKMIVPLEVARAESDGYTIGGFNDSIMTMVPNLQSKMRWDILKDFEPVSLVATVEWGLIANNQTSYKTAADLIAAAKAAPGKIDYGSGGPGSPQHLAMAMFASAAGISLTHVPYKGATQAATDVAAGQIPVGFQGLGTVAPLVRGGQLRLIGVTTQSRLPQFPDVPTVSESGLPGFFFNSWFAILAPAGTPKDIIARLNAEVRKAVGDPETRRKLEELGFAVRGSSPEELGAMTREQLAKYARVIKEMGISNE